MTPIPLLEVVEIRLAPWRGVEVERARHARRPKQLALAERAHDDVLEARGARGMLECAR